MSTAGTTIDIPDLINQNKIGSFQVGMLILCGLCVIMDGFDVQAMGYVAPAIIADWHVSKANLGPVFGAGLLGMLVGSLVFSITADKFGRRPVLIGSTIFFSLCMLVTPLATTIEQLQLIRFITGLGLGAVMPNAMALAGEYSPLRKKVTLMMLVSCGFTLGAVLGGLLSAALIPAFGWQSVFYVGGVVPLAIGVLMFFLLPESMQFLVLKNKNLHKVAQWLKRIDPGVKITPDTQYVVHEKESRGAPVLALFREGRAKMTVLLWVINFMNLLNLYFLSTLRSTGIGWSLGVGRIGSIIGPVLGGELIRLNWPNSTIFLVVAIPAIVSAAMVFSMRAGSTSAVKH